MEMNMHRPKAEEPKAYENRPDIADNPIYPELARVTLFDLHANALDIMTDNLAAFQGPKNLVVVGPGKEAVPFSENLETVVSMLDGGNLVLMDYNSDICDKIPGYLQKRGFGEHFEIVRKKKGDVIDPRESRGTIYVIEQDIADGLPVADGSVQGVDMTLSVHHATMYSEDITDIGKKILQSLVPGGFLHVGEGDVDMKYSERKIKDIVQTLYDVGERGVRLSDWRNSEMVSYFGDKNYSARLAITEDGEARLLLSDMGNAPVFMMKYGASIASDQVLFFPLIDVNKTEDFEGLVRPVCNYYDAIEEVTLPRLDPELHDKFFAALRKERSDAARGLVEFYTAPQEFCERLGDAGFDIENLHYTEHGPFVNILARRL